MHRIELPVHPFPNHLLLDYLWHGALLHHVSIHVVLIHFLQTGRKISITKTSKATLTELTHISLKSFPILGPCYLIMPYSPSPPHPPPPHPLRVIGLRFESIPHLFYCENASKRANDNSIRSNAIVEMEF